MLNWLAKRADASRKAENLYGVVVAQARSPSFFRDFGVSDTLEGRFEMIVLHMFLVLERLRGRAPADTSRALIERFVTDMDDCMREIGVGDLTVPKKVKRAAAALYERAGNYRRASADGGDALAEALGKVFAEVPHCEARSRELGRYMQDAAAALEGQDLQRILDADLAFPDPSGFAPEKEIP